MVKHLLLTRTQASITLNPTLVLQQEALIARTQAIDVPVPRQMPFDDNPLGKEQDV